MESEELAVRVAAGETQFLAQLYENNRKLLYALCNRFYMAHKEQCARCGVALEDLISESFFALQQAATAYAGSRKYSFSAYLTYPLKNRFAAALGWRTKGGAGEPLNACVSLDAPVKEGEESTISDILPADSNLEDEALRSLDMAGVFPAAERALTPTEYDCIERYYKQGQTYGVIAQQSGKTYSAVRSINERALRKLRRSHEILEQWEDYIGATYRMGGLGRFKDTGQSCVEWAVMKREMLEKEE